MPVTNNQQKTYWHMIGTSEMRSKMGQLKKYELSGFGILFFLLVRHSNKPTVSGFFEN